MRVLELIANLFGMVMLSALLWWLLTPVLHLIARAVL